MLIFLRCVSLFLMIVFLVIGFHCFLLNFSWVVYDGVRSWSGSFECGFCRGRLVENYFSFTYFGFLVFFVIFDLEVSLLLGLPFQGVLYKNLVPFFFFLSLLSLGFSVEVLKGYVSWSY